MGQGRMGQRMRSALRAARRTGADIGLAEIISFEKQGRTMVPGNGVGKAIAQVQLRRMPTAFSITGKRRQGGIAIRFTDRNRP